MLIASSIQAVGRRAITSAADLTAQVGAGNMGRYFWGVRFHFRNGFESIFEAKHDCRQTGHVMICRWLVVWNIFCPYIGKYWEQSSQLTFIFSRGVETSTTNQV